jgi:hypothetical protein
MATAKKAKKVSRASLMRQYYNGNPNATVNEVAKKFKTSYQIAYMVKRAMEPKKVVLSATEVVLANKLGIPTVEYAKQRVKILKETKRKPTKDPLSTLPQVGDSIGGLTLTRKEKDGMFEYRWVKDDAVNTLTTAEGPKADPVNHPAHYKVGGIETIDFIEAKDLGYHLGNAVKYISRANHKGNRLQDLQKAKWYIDRAIEKAGA